MPWAFGLRPRYVGQAWHDLLAVSPLLADGFLDDFVEEMRPGLQFVFRLHERGQASSPFDQAMIKGRIRLGPP